jgi:hypothetical protein
MQIANIVIIRESFNFTVDVCKFHIALRSANNLILVCIRLSAMLLKLLMIGIKFVFKLNMQEWVLQD